MKIGIIGAGQLGQMLALAGYPLALQFRFLDSSAEAPGARVAPIVVGAFDDLKALRRLAGEVDVVTYEFENVPEAAVAECLRHKPVRPGVRPIHLAQHRLREKEFFRGLGIGTADYQPIRNDADVAAATALPGVLKTCTEGYDGKGQARVSTRADLAAAWTALDTPVVPTEPSISGASPVTAAMAAVQPPELSPMMAMWSASRL